MIDARLKDLRKRIQALPVKLRDSGLMDDLLALNEQWDDFLYEELNEDVTSFEESILENPFTPVPDNSSLSRGDYSVVEAKSDLGIDPIRMSILPNRPNKVYHTCIFGNVGSGKSMLQAIIASQASSDCFSFLVDSSRTFRNVESVRDSHRLIRMEDLRLNPWDEISELPLNLSDAVINHLFAKHVGLQFGEYELNQACEEIRQSSSPVTLPRLIEFLEKKRYPPGSRRTYYRDSAVLGLKNILNTSGDGNIYRCRRGMNVLELLQGNTVLEMSGLAESQTFIAEFLLTYVELLVCVGILLKKPLVFFLDEAQLLQSSDRNRLSAFILNCRHLGIHLVFNFQNASLCPVELLSNSDAIFSFKQVDERDRQTVRQVANLNEDQADYLAGLDPGQCLAFFPKSDWKYPILCKTPIQKLISTSNQEILDLSERAVRGLHWTPEESQPVASDDQEAPTADEGQPSGIEQAAEAFMKDVLNQGYEFSPAMQRWERAGIRSASTQEAVLKNLLNQGLVNDDRLPLNLRGPSIVLYEPTAKALNQYGVHWKPRGRGKLSTRAATHHLMEALSGIEGIRPIREGTLEGKQVDILIHHQDGSITTLEIAGATGKHEVHNALHCISIPEVKKHLIVCLGSKVMNEVKRRINAHAELKKNPKLEISLLSRFLKSVKEDGL